LVEVAPTIARARGSHHFRASIPRNFDQKLRSFIRDEDIF
jgi:hypothetical protein